MRHAAIALVLLFTGVASAQDLIGTWSFTGREKGKPVTGIATIVSSGANVVLTQKWNGGSRTAKVLKEGLSDAGPWSLDVDASPEGAGAAGTLARIGGEARDVAAVGTTTIQLKSTNGQLEAVIRQGDKEIGTARFVREKAALTIHAKAWSATDSNAFREYARQAGSFYKGMGYSRIDKIEGDSWATIIKALDDASNKGIRYGRIVFVGHGGWDGPMMGFEQVSQRNTSESWTEFLRALKTGATPDAKMYVSACHAGGSDRYERASETSPLPIWVDDVAKATGIQVAGPAGKTSTEYTLRHVTALEGNGSFVQEMRIAKGGSGKSVLPGRGL